MYGGTSIHERFWKCTSQCRYRADCPLKRKTLIEAVKNGTTIKLDEVHRDAGEKAFYDVSSSSAARHWPGVHADFHLANIDSYASYKSIPNITREFYSKYRWTISYPLKVFVHFAACHDQNNAPIGEYFRRDDYQRHHSMVFSIMAETSSQDGQHPTNTARQLRYKPCPIALPIESRLHPKRFFFKWHPHGFLQRCGIVRGARMSDADSINSALF